ncbi:MAG: 3-dehydroquinate synthase [Bacteroidales bacterium]|nr:3-dehydroquinate synthase [Bacteroidales bacterium]
MFTPNKIAVIADPKVEQLFPHYLDSIYPKIPKIIFRIDAQEQNKSIEQAAFLWQQLLDHQLDKQSLIINWGGGIISDLGGFVASTFKRGIPFINVPTSLLGMIDAAIGGKNGINLNQVKNSVGTINKAKDVIIDFRFLETLPQEQLLNGFGELVKYALIGSKSLWNEIKNMQSIHFQDIKKEWIDFCIDFKKEVVDRDLYDLSTRRILNFGHTLGHAIESSLMSTEKPILHGYAVAMGCVAEANLSWQHGFLSEAEYCEIKNVIFRLFDGESLWKAIHWATTVKFCQYDKKNESGRINITMLEGIGKATPNHFVDAAEIKFF